MSRETKPDEERGEWFLTISGRRIFVLDPRPDDIDIGDIAYALAHICRFGGHVTEFYSVAQHSVLVSLLVPVRMAGLGLMHDATEAYLGDVIRPLKLALPEYQRIEALWWHAIATRFGLPWEMPAGIKAADRAALATERRDFQTQTRWPVRDDERVTPTATVLIAEAPAVARKVFLARFHELFARSR